MDTIGMARPSHWYFIKVPQSDFTLTITMASQPVSYTHLTAELKVLLYIIFLPDTHFLL